LVVFEKSEIASLDAKVIAFVIGFVEVMAFIGSAPIGNVRWQVNIILSALYVVGIGLSGYSLFKGDKK
jgi:hypothetical protein